MCSVYCPDDESQCFSKFEVVLWQLKSLLKCLQYIFFEKYLNSNSRYISFV